MPSLKVPAHHLRRRLPGMSVWLPSQGLAGRNPVPGAVFRGEAAHVEGLPQPPGLRLTYTTEHKPYEQIDLGAHRR